MNIVLLRHTASYSTKSLDKSKQFLRGIQISSDRLKRLTLIN